MHTSYHNLSVNMVFLLSHFTPIIERIFMVLIRLYYLDHDKVRQNLRRRGIDWIYNAPLVSARGGAWERLIQSVRHIFSSFSNDPHRVKPSQEKLITFLLKYKTSLTLVLLLL